MNRGLNLVAREERDLTHDLVVAHVPLPVRAACLRLFDSVSRVCGGLIGRIETTPDHSIPLTRGVIRFSLETDQGM